MLQADLVVYRLAGVLLIVLVLLARKAPESSFYSQYV
jgi:hypothetical protein